MKNFIINRQIQTIDSVIKKIDSISSPDIELYSHWAKYICVLVSGLLENSIHELYNEFVKKSSHEPVARYAEIQLNKIKNPNTEAFLNIAGSFKDTWRSELDNFISTSGQKEAIDAIIANRHHIVHGKQSGITLARIKDYYKKSLEVLEFIEKQLV